MAAGPSYQFGEPSSHLRTDSEESKQDERIEQLIQKLFDHPKTTKDFFDLSAPQFKSVLKVRYCLFVFCILMISHPQMGNANYRSLTRTVSRLNQSFQILNVNYFI